MNYIIVDLEATCWHNKPPTKNEIIEIGAVLINDDKEVVAEFCRFIKPLTNPVLSDFCTELTSIQQSDIDTADTFDVVIAEFQAWIAQGAEDYVLCSWGFYDQKQFASDCELYDIDSTWTKQHISVKHQYATIKKLKRAIGMKKALMKENMVLTGTHHRGIDDARNISKIFIQYFKQWNYPLTSEIKEK